MVKEAILTAADLAEQLWERYGHNAGRAMNEPRRSCSAVSRTAIRSHPWASTLGSGSQTARHRGRPLNLAAVRKVQ